MEKVAGTFLLAAFTISTSAQSDANSSHSQYGLGLLSDRTSEFNRDMSGLGYSFGENDQVNFINPASCSAFDSLTSVFDAGISGQLTNFAKNGKERNVRNADLEHVVAGLCLTKHLGLSFGLTPFINVGYNYVSTSTINVDKSYVKTMAINTYAGNDGLHQVYLGTGRAPSEGFSLGVNISYLWGGLNRSVVNSYSDQSVDTVPKFYSAQVKNYKLDLGLQYTAQSSKRDQATLDAMYSLRYKLGADSALDVISQNPQADVQDTTAYSVISDLELFTAMGGGLARSHQSRLKLDVDYLLQQWLKTEPPVYSIANGVPQYALSKNEFNDQHRPTVDGESYHDVSSRSFLKRIRYRLGASYATPYMKVNGVDSPREINVSTGFGIPIVNAYNNRSLLNIFAQQVRQDSKVFIIGNTFHINIGLTPSGRWFAKWRAD